MKLLLVKERNIEGSDDLLHWVASNNHIVLSHWVVKLQIDTDLLEEMWHQDLEEDVDDEL
jgi:hypothetical protein